MKSNFLIVYSAYNSQEYVEKSLTPFLTHPNCWVVASSRRFGLFPEPRKDFTVDILNFLKNKYPNQFVGIDSDKEPVKREHEAKNRALEIFSEFSKEIDAPVIDYVWIVDSDEFYSTEEIQKVIDFVDSPEFSTTVWFSIPLKNFVFDENTFLSEPFCPPRIFRTSFSMGWTVPPGNFYLHSFFWDNDIAYANKDDLVHEQIPLYNHDSFARKTIPTSEVWIKHLSWLNNNRGKKKVEYQESHFGHCGFKWVEGKGLEFNQEYYDKTGQPLPKTETVTS